MAGLLYLTASDFHLGKGQTGKLLYNNIARYSVVLFYAPSCEFSVPYLNIFKSLPGNIGGCTFGIANIQKHMAIVKESKATISPIEFVPLVIYYVDGRPFMKYNGDAVCDQIVSFICDVTKKLSEPLKSGFHENKIKQSEKEGKIPEYCIGKPKQTSLKFVGDMICNDGVCYLSEGNDVAKAQQGQKNQAQRRQ